MSIVNTWVFLGGVVPMCSQSFPLVYHLLVQISSPLGGVLEEEGP